MNSVRILDCTLRDGGYCNHWNFGFENVCKIISGLMDANVDIVECGYLSNRVIYNRDITQYTSVEDIRPLIDYKQDGKMFVVMLNYGEYDLKNLPERGTDSIDGIRVAFHKKNLLGALEMCREIKEKGYKVFIQPMLAASYSDEEFLQLIRMVNEVQPYAFYIVDSFGMMKEKELERFFFMVEHNLDSIIWVGFHAHNNMQLAYSNAQKLVMIHTNRNLIIDTSVYGMGRGAGNLNTELFLEFLNESSGTQYELKPLLSIIDEIINEFYQENYWGYSLPNYLSARHHAHPNYAKYLDDKKTLTVKDMESIFEMMDNEKCYDYDSDYIESLYMRYMMQGREESRHEAELRQALHGSKVLLIAPGKSSSEERENIKNYLSQNDVISIGVNFDYPYAKTDYIFLSNLRRISVLDGEVGYERCIVTSNIPIECAYFRTKYSSLLNDIEAVKDKAGLMAIKFLMNYNVKEILLAGFDGYMHDMEENYGEREMAFYTRNVVLDALNSGMSKVMKQYAEKVKLTFLTEPKYITI